jgi:hypothetical protein
MGAALPDRRAQGGEDIVLREALLAPIAVVEDRGRADRSGHAGRWSRRLGGRRGRRDFSASTRATRRQGLVVAHWR